MSALLHPAGRFSASLGREEPVVRRLLKTLAARRVLERLWAKDPSLWTRRPGTQRRIGRRLGWLDAPEAMRREIEGLVAFARGIKSEGFTHVVLLGMGGSSLCPDVCRRTFGVAAGYPNFQVLSSIHPAEILRIERSVTLASTLFVVASKAGVTLETQCLTRYFWARLQAIHHGRRGGAGGGRGVGAHFVALTDPGTPLEAFAKTRRFRRVFSTSPEIGGRYAALSFTGLVPAALLGMDLVQFLDRVAADDRDALRLGAILGGLARQGRDKVTFVLAPEIASFGLWLEQLLAESTGKEGRGLIPVEGEPLGTPQAYGRDRLFVSFEVGESTASTTAVTRRRLRAIEAARHPVVRIRLRDTFDLAGEFFRWEIAAAVAGAILNVNPFDEPDVIDSKTQTRRLLNVFRRTRRLPSREPVLVDAGSARQHAIRVYTAAQVPDRAAKTFAMFLRHILGQVRPGHYAAIMAYLERSPRHETLLQRLRLTLRDRYRIATTLGYGPSLLHSSGQVHKGGPATGLFLQMTAPDSDAEHDLAIPGEPYSFPTFTQAAALGDYLALAGRGRRVVEIRLGRDVEGGLRRCLKALG